MSIRCQISTIGIQASLAIAALFVAAACHPINPRGEAATDAGAPRLVLEQRFEGSEADSFFLTGDTQSLIVDGDDNIYVLTDARSKTELSSFAPDGRLRWVVNENGRGPGEIRYAWGLAWDGDGTLYLANQVATRIDRFTLDGEFIGSKSVPEIGPARLLVFGYLTPGRLIGFEPIAGEFGGRISVLDTTDDWAVVDTFSIRQSGNRNVSDQTSLSPRFFTLDDEIVAGNMVEYRYTWYRPNGDISRDVGRDDVAIEPPRIWESGLGVNIMTPSDLWPLVRLGEGVLLGGGKWPRIPAPQEVRIGGAFGRGNPTAHVRNLDVFDAESGDLLRSLDAESYGIKRLLASDSNGRFFAELDEEELVIGRFRIEGLD